MLPSTLKAQQKQTKSKVKIIQADSIVGGIIQDSIAVQKILGDVHMKSKKLDMYADSAYRFMNLQKVQAFGNIEIDAPKQTIWADTLTYYSDIDFSKLRGRVIIRSDSDSTTIFCNSVDYRFTNKVAHFRDRIRMVDPKGVLVADRGFYFRKADSASFRGQVQLRDSLKYIEGDTLYSSRRRGYYEMHGDVYANDPKNNSMLKGDYLQADSAGRRLVIGHAWLKNYKQDSTATDSTETDSLLSAPSDTAFHPQADSLHPSPPDSEITAPDSTQAAQPDTSQTAQPDTTHIHAYRILSIAHRSPTDTTTTVKAYKNVRIWSPDFSALSDSARYESKPHTFELWTNMPETKPPKPQKSDSLQSAPSDTAQVADTTHVKADTLQSAPPDSEAALPDSTQAIPPDTSQTVDTTSQPRPDSLHPAPPDSEAAAPDSAQAAQPAAPLKASKAWHKNIQLTGPYIRVKLKNGDIKKLVSYPNPFTVQEDTTIDRLNQIKGDTLRASFVDGQLSLIIVYPHSHLLRFTKKDGKPDGIIEVQAPLTKIFFDDGKLIKLKAFGKEKQITGDYLPKSKENAKRELDGFTWNPKQRPQRPKEEMKRHFPPIPKGPPFKLPMRYLEHTRSDSLKLAPANKKK